MTRIQKSHFTYNAVVSFNAYHENKLSQYNRDCQIFVKCSCARTGSTNTFHKIFVLANELSLHKEDISYMCARVLLNLLNELRKRDKYTLL